MKTFDVNNILLKIQSPGIVLGSHDEDYLVSQIEKLGKMFPRIEKCELLLKMEKNDKKKNFVVEANLFVPQNIFFSKKQEDSFHLAGKKVFEDLHDQLFKLKEKFQEKNLKVEEKMYK